MKKKILVALMVAGMMAMPVMASVDLSGMSFEELLELQKEVNMAIWESDGWQEVEVPVGVYQVGKEIPAGDWTLAPAKSTANFASYESNNSGDLKGLIMNGSLTEKDGDEAKVSLYEGNWIEISINNMVFKPYTVSFSFN